MTARTVHLTEPQVRALLAAVAERDVTLEDREGEGEETGGGGVATRERALLERARRALAEALPRTADGAAG